MNGLPTKWSRFRFADATGASLLETALVMPLLVLILVMLVDLGRAFYIAIEVQSAAEAGAIYGAMNHTDVNGMIAAVKSDAANIASIAASANYGCRCAVGGASIAGCTVFPSACTYNTVDYVEVTATAVYSPVLKIPGVPSSYPFKAKVNMRAAHW